MSKTSAPQPKRARQPSTPAEGSAAPSVRSDYLEDASSPDTEASGAKLLRRDRELAILNAIAGALNRSLDVQEGLRETLALVGDLLGLHAGWVWLLDDEGNPCLAAAQALPPYLADPAHPERMSGSCHCLRTFRRGNLRGAANVNIVECSRLWEAYHTPGNHAAEAEGLRYHASIPLYAGTKKLGVLNVASADWRRLEADDLRFLATIGHQVGLAVERARLSGEGTRAAARLAIAEERNRLAREIHDTLAQNLAGITLYLEAAEQALPTSGGRAREGVQRALDLARVAMREARRSVADLRAAPLQDRTLPQALLDLVEQARRETGARVVYVAPSEFPSLPARIEASLYRIAQEALTNVARHAQAHNVYLTLTQDAQHVTLSVGDDGKGFDPERLSQRSTGDDDSTGHFGLVGMGERARLLGATLQLESAPGEGTRVEVSVPIS